MLYLHRDNLRCMTTLAERVTEAIAAAKENGFSVKQIAQGCGIKDKAVYQWMDGRTKSINGGNVAVLAEMSGYNALWITREKGPRCHTRAIRQAIKLMEKMTPARQADAVKIIAPLVDQTEVDERTDTRPQAGVLAERVGQRTEERRIATADRRGDGHDQPMGGKQWR